MNTQRLVRRCLAGLMAVAVAGLAAPLESGQLRPVRVKPTTPSARLPLASGAVPSSGTVELAIGVDAAGQVTDLLPVAATSGELGAAAVEVARTWEYRPATIAGQPRASVTHLVLDVADGQVHVRPPNGEGGGSYASERSERALLRPARLHELDRPLRPRSVSAPRYPDELQERQVSGLVTLRFLVDQSGAVRLPHVVQADSPELAALALEAVNRWEFQPPTRGGQPVVVAARQEFRFNPGRAP